MNMLETGNRKNYGMVFGIAAATTYGLFSVFSNYFVKSYDPIVFVGLAMLIGSLPFVVSLQIKGNQKYIFGNTKYFARLISIAALSGLGMMLFFLGTKLTSGINTSLLSQVEPIYSVIIAYFILGEKRKIREVGAIIFMVLGACIVVFRGFNIPNIGDLFIFIAPAFYQLSHVVSKKIIGEVPDNIIPGARLFYGGLAVTIIGIIWHPASISAFLGWSQVLSVVLFALIFQTLDMFFWYTSLKKLPLSIASSLIPASLLVAFAGSIILLKEIPTVQQYIGLFAILSVLVWIASLHLKAEK